MNILFLTNNSIAYPLYEWLISNGENVTYCEEKVTADDVLNQNIEFIVSYNYRFLIAKDVLSLLPHRVVNLHISYLPWNRGASPNLWSFLENTPCGVTIHEVDPSLDTGDILVQEKLEFDFEKETLRSSYEESHRTIQRLFRDHWKQIKAGSISPKKQQGEGTMHRMRDLETYAPCIDYDLSISEFVRLVKSYGK